MAPAVVVYTPGDKTEHTAIVFPRPSDGITGLRFIAAMMVAGAHGIYALVPYVDAYGVALDNVTRLSLFTTQTSGLGMSLFFVLSGFVIHFNYFESLKKFSWRHFHNFVVARFARLYPLYFTALALELLIGKFLLHYTGDPITDGYSARALPYFLTMTQSWVWTDFLGSSLIYQFGPIAQISWSISTEWFFYMAYPLIALCFIRLRGLRWTLIVTGAFVVAGYICVLIIASPHGMQIINERIEAPFGGPVADIGTNFQDSLFRWILYFCPYSRVGEFLCGCFAAHIYLLVRERGYNLFSTRAANSLAIVAAGFLLASHVVIFLPFKLGLPSWVRYLHMNFGYSLGAMLLIYCIASSPSWLERILSSRLLVIGGGMSYSIYLLHMALWTALSRSPMGPQYYLIALYGLRLVAAFAILLFICYAVYRHFEDPARAMLRSVLVVPPQRQGFDWRYAIGFVIVIAPFATIAVGALWPIGGADRIWDVAARYGGKCGIAGFHQSGVVASACADKTSCEFTVDVAKLGDPAPGCAKDFEVIWRCSKDHSTRHIVHLPAEAGLGSIASLSCPAD